MFTKFISYYLLFITLLTYILLLYLLTLLLLFITLLTIYYFILYCTFKIVLREQHFSYLYSDLKSTKVVLSLIVYLV